MFWKSIKTISLLGVLFISLQLSVAQETVDKYIQQRSILHEGIDNKQSFMDVFDGNRDSIITFKNPLQTETATYTYINLVDFAQELIESSSKSGLDKLTEVAHLYGTIQKLNSSNYTNIEYFEPIFSSIVQILEVNGYASLDNILYKNLQASISNISLFNQSEEALPFLKKAAYQYPNEVLKEFGSYERMPYAQEVLEHVARISPQAIKKYLPGKNIINAYLLNSTDTVVMKLITLYRQFGSESKVYYFLDIILNDSTASPSLLNSMAQYPKVYLNALIKMRQKDHPIGEYDLESELSIRALEQVRKVNDLHDETNQNIRFEAVQNLNAVELYTLIVYSPEEIFTSTFNGMFTRLQFQMKQNAMSGYQLLQEASFNKFRTFIKLCAGYNALDKFLATMSPQEADEVLHKFVSTLNSDDGDLSEAVNVADTFGSLEDTARLSVMEKYLKEEYQQTSLDDNRKVLYGLLLKLLYKKTGTVPDSLLAVELENYQLPVLDQIEYQSLVSADTATQMHFFFDDEDGLTSFSTFLQAFKTAGWKVLETQYYVKIYGKGKAVIYANKPLFEREGQIQLSEMVEKGEIRPTIIVHRGHSYYAMNTISQIPSYARIVFLGSCGGYHNLSEVVKRAPDANIISSKQIGTYVVNNTLLIEMSNTIATQQNLAWADLWKRLNLRLKGSGTGYERFLDYVPPHKNMGAIFIRAYQQASGG